jgi:hypothetical protein
VSQSCCAGNNLEGNGFLKPGVLYAVVVAAAAGTSNNVIDSMGVQCRGVGRGWACMHMHSLPEVNLLALRTE